MRSSAILSSIALIASFHPARAGEKLLYAFTGGSDGAAPSGQMVNVNGVLYGTTAWRGANDAVTVFAFNTKTNKFSVVYALPAGAGGFISTGQNPGLLYSGGMLYGATLLGGAYGAGVIFRVNPTTGVGSVLYSFQGGNGNTDGNAPGGGLTAFGGLIYGTTVGGGTNGVAIGGYGTIFAIDPTTGVKQTVYNFQNGADGAFPGSTLYNLNGILYGLTSGGTSSCSCGVIFKFDPSNNTVVPAYTYQNANDGDVPTAALLYLNGSFIGMNAGGGLGLEGGQAAGYGTIFSFNPSTGEYSDLYAFKGGNNGYLPDQPVQYLQGNLYGVTQYGGSRHCYEHQGCGTVFQLNPTTGAQKVLYAFTTGTGYGDTDTANPAIVIVGKKIYGTAAADKKAPWGSIFSIEP
jgi:uncharacterized repeat protein (TIGR03803 family)